MTAESAAAPEIVFCNRPCQADANALESVRIDPAQLGDDFTDYSRAVVRKPWGYEYLIFAGPSVAVWILHIKSGAQTSMHCHPNKTTSLVVLDGEAECSTLTETYPRNAGQALRLGAGVFHRTKAVSDGGIFVMEVESPVNKRDLVRVKDDYGREAQAYESGDWLSRDLGNFNYFSAIDDSAYYNTRKSFGDAGVIFRALGPGEEMRPLGRLAILLSGSVTENGCRLAEPGQLLDASTNHNGLLTSGPDGAQLIEVTGPGFGVRTAESLVTRLWERDVRDVFYVPDSVNAHLVDALVRDTRMRSFAFDSERAACLAAEGYAKASGKPGVLFVSSGASSLNAMNGLANAWVDSCPLVVVSGQSLTTEAAALTDGRLRQAANKTLNIVDIVAPVTKSAELVHAPQDVCSAVDRALRTAAEGRPGPCWVDIPIDVLGGETNLQSVPAPGARTESPDGLGCSPDDIARLRQLLSAAKRPVVLAGYGVRGSGAVADFRDMAGQLGIPVLLTRRGMELLAHDDRLNFGVAGAYGQRAANFILQNADLLICIGARFSRSLTGRRPESFAAAAIKVVVDADARELHKPLAQLGLAICSDAGDFCRAVTAAGMSCDAGTIKPWMEQARSWRVSFPAGGEAAQVNAPLADPIRFIAGLSDLMDDDEVVSVESGFVLDCFIHGFRSKSRQTVLSSPGLESPGFAVPAAVGASIAGRGRRVIVLTDTLGINSALGELRTVAARGIPLKIFVFDAPANLTLRRVQHSYFGGRFVPSPLFEHWSEKAIGMIATAAGIPLAVSVAEALASAGPSLHQLRVPEDYEIKPRRASTVTSSGLWSTRPLEDMYPFLDHDQVAAIMGAAREGHHPTKS
jgi:acetolactate synthase-1/2/3 large subunit